MVTWPQWKTIYVLWRQLRRKMNTCCINSTLVERKYSYKKPLTFWTNSLTAAKPTGVHLDSNTKHITRGSTPCSRPDTGNVMSVTDIPWTLVITGLKQRPDSYWWEDWVESDLVCNHTSDYKIGRPQSGSLICHLRVWLQTDIGRHEVHLPINHKDYNFREAQEIKILLPDHWQLWK